MKQIEVPLKPLAVSKAWQGRRFKTPTYKQWQNDFLKLVKKQSPLKGNISMTVEFYIKNDKMTDIDNLLKTLQDTLKLSGLIEDDRFIHELHCYKYHSKNEFIRVTLSNL